MGEDSIIEFEDRRKQSLWERLDSIEQEARRGHRDIRKSVSELEAQADAFDQSLKVLTAHVEDVKDAPIESTKIRFSTAVMVSIVVLTASVVGGAWRVTTKIDTLGTDMARQSEIDKKERADLAKLYDERNVRYEKSLDSLVRQVELLKYEQQRLREDVTKKGPTR